MRVLRINIYGLTNLSAWGLISQEPFAPLREGYNDLLGGKELRACWDLKRGICLQADPPEGEDRLSHYPMAWHPVAAWAPVPRDPYRMVSCVTRGAGMNHSGTGNAEAKEHDEHYYFG